MPAPAGFFIPKNQGFTRIYGLAGFSNGRNIHNTQPCGKETTSMAENTTNTGQETTAEADSSATGFTPIESQEALNRIISDRLGRERAKYADYADLKAKAAKYDELEEASKSDLEKAQSRAQEAEQKLKAYERAEQLRQWRNEVAAETGVPVDVIAGDDLEQMRSHAVQVKTVIEKAAPSRGAGFLPSEGEPTTPALNSPELEDSLRRALGIS